MCTQYSNSYTYTCTLYPCAHITKVCTHVCTCWLSELTPETMQPLMTKPQSVCPLVWTLRASWWRREKVLDFIANGCGCAAFKSGPCSGMFSYEPSVIRWKVVTFSPKRILSPSSTFTPQTMFTEYTIHMIWHNRYITRQILYNPARYTFSPHGNVPYLAHVVKLYKQTWKDSSTSSSTAHQEVMYPANWNQTVMRR